MRSIIPCPRAHFQSQTPADAETGSSGGKPEINGPLERKGPVWAFFILTSIWADISCTKSSSTYHLVVTESLSSLNGPVQAGFANVQVLSVRVLREQLEKCPDVHIVVIVHVAEPPEEQGDVVKDLLRLLKCLTGTCWKHYQTYFFPDSMNLSYSTAILQDRAWRLWAEEQLVLMTRFPAWTRGRCGSENT